MYYCIAEIELDLDEVTSYDGKILSSLCQKIRQRHKVSCQHGQQHDSDASIFVCFFTQSEMQAGQALDKILITIENEGMGRIKTEHSIIEHTESIRLGND